MRISLFILLLLVSCGNQAETQKSIRFTGSNTSNEVVKALAAHYNRSQNKLPIEVEGGGSEKAIRSFLTGDIRYLNSSRRITETEMELAGKNGVNEIREIIIGLDAIALIVNPKLGVHELSIREVAEILEGKIRNWKALGGPDLEIKLYGRNRESGTYHFMKSKFIRQGFSTAMNYKDTPAEIVNAVKKDPAAFAYTDLASIRQNGMHFPSHGIWAINLGIDGAEAVSPFERMAVLEGHYPLTRPLYQYVSGTKNQQVSAFIRFELSAEGQELIEKKGFFPILPIHRQFNSENGF